MRQLFTISMLLLGLVSMAQRPSFEEALTKKQYRGLAGKNYFVQWYESNRLGSKDSAVLFTIIPSRYVQVQKVYHLDSTERKQNTIILLTKDASTVFHEGSFDEFSNCNLKNDTSIYFLVAVRESPSDYKRFDPKTAVNGQLFYLYDSLVSDATVTMSRVWEKPVDLDSNQFYLPPGGHTSFREFFCTSCGIRNLTKMVQEKLKEKGYDVPVNNKLEEASRNALIDYQKKHGLPVGNLNVETLKHLGIEGY